MEQAGAVMERQHQPGPWIPRRVTSAAADWSPVADRTAPRRRQGAQIEVGKLRAVGRAISTGEAAELRKVEVDEAEERREISKMPEHREIKRTGLTDLSGGGFFIRRVSSPGALAGRRAGWPLSRRFPSPSSNKENVPPVWAVKATPARRRTPLPDWYPRTPLRDITAIVKFETAISYGVHYATVTVAVMACTSSISYSYASVCSFFRPADVLTIDFQAIERSRLRIAAARQQSEIPEQSPQPASFSTTVPAEQDISHCTEAQDSLAIASGSASTSLDEHSFKVYSSPSKSSLNTPTKPIDPALADLMEKKLSSSIEQIEKTVKKNLKRIPKAAQPSKRANQRRTLMSMR
ncbi:hypothetical protein ACQ4PT_024800 [Festuca glaucescens]